MKDLSKNGHKYELASFEGGAPQTLQFIEKSPMSEGSSEMKTINDGTTNEEVLEMLIDRTTHLYNNFPSEETASAIVKMIEALMWFQRRTAKRIARGVEGKHIA